MSTRPPDVGGGTPGTALLVFLHESEELLGGSQLRRVVEIGARTSPSDIYFQTRIPLPPPPPLPPGELRLQAQNVADVLAGAIEDSLVGPYIQGMAYRQDVNQANQILDEMEIFWATNDGVAEGSVVLNLQRVEPTYVNAAVQAAVAAFLP